MCVCMCMCTCQEMSVCAFLSVCGVCVCVCVCVCVRACVRAVLCCAVLCCAALRCAALRCAAQLSLHRHTQCPSVGPQPWERCFGKPACVILWLQPANVTEESRQGRNAKQRLS